MQVTQTQRTTLTCNDDGRRSTTGKTYIDIGLGLQAIGNPKNIDYLNKLKENYSFTLKLVYNGNRYTNEEERYYEFCNVCRM